MSIDLIGSFYTNGAEAHALKTVIAAPSFANFSNGNGTAAYSGLFGAGSLITNITCMPSATLGGTCTISAYGMSASLTANIVQFSNFNNIVGYGAQSGVTLPQDSWLQASGTGVVPTLVVSYLS
jgi:hypothetical protein